MNVRRFLFLSGLAAALASGCHSGAPKAKPRGPTPPAAARPSPSPVPSPAPSARPAVPTPDLSRSLVAPTIRIGFNVDVARVSIGGADSGMRVLVGQRSSTAQRLTFELANPAAGAAVKFRVQAASLTDLATAQQAARKIADATGLGVEPVWNEATRTYQVKAGSFPAREDAAALSRQIDALGFSGAFVTTENEAGAAAGLVRVIETGELAPAVVLQTVNPEEKLAIGTSPVRGYVEVRAGSGGVTAVNVLNLEDYLRGVVPNELSPGQFPQIEALKAQAVAARTYALRNMGQYKERGYDICATPACQVYRGFSTEHPLTDQAIAETAGIVAQYRGELINALYTSTCGGHTEDGFNMFPTQTQAYLKGVECVAERDRLAVIRSNGKIAQLGPEPGINRDVALLMALDVIGGAAESAVWLTEALRPEEAEAWTQRLLRSLGRKGCEAKKGSDLGRRGAFFVYVSGALCWNERADRLLSERDVEFLRQSEDQKDFASPEEARAAAILIQEEVLTPSASGSLAPGGRILRSTAIGILARSALRMGPPSLDRAEFAGGSEGEFRFRTNDTIQAVRVSDRLRLFRDLSGTPVAASELALTQGDKVRYILTDGRLAFLVAEQSRMGPSADRSSRLYRWEERLTPAQIAKSMERYGKAGRVLDLQVRRTGVSGRVIELAVQGTEREIVLKGLEVRFALGVRENLFVIDRELAKDGSVRQFVFTGKGWGHGVGLCQVGAFGMAQAGATYEDILKHYYSGIDLVRAAPPI
ncbi:MAG: SpoIID/LytB domain-containing protein [Vicinamibacteria bacterium]|nr:SpoIID/LytB domain-containing protein [Vicinamibacteria bacterium]